MVSGPRISPGETRIAGRLKDGWIVGDRLYRPALLVTGDAAWSLPGQTLETLAVADFPDLGGAELLLIGTGEIQLRAPAEVVEAARKRGWRIEAMDSASAARTFNVLVAEDRLVAALIL